jgi:exodeoxyribonuclease VII large subunit
MSADTFSVSEISQVIRDQIALTFPTELWVRGQIQNLKRAQSGHVYFDLVAADAGDDVLGVTLFAATKRQVNERLKRGGGVRMTDGTEVRIRARLEWFGPRGRVQLRMSDIDPEFTLGRIESEREALLLKLKGEGLLDANAGRPVPTAPLRIGLVTSEQSAAYHDFVAELQASSQHWRVLLVHTAVQGPGAEHDVAAAIRAAEAAGVELIAVVRGGGARTDLATFDKEVIARTVAACRVPVFVGIGHEIDRTAIEELAARAFKTPTACAAAICQLVATHLDRADLAWERIRTTALHRLTEADQRLRRRAAALERHTGIAIGRAETALALGADRLQRDAVRTTDRSAHQLDVAADQLRHGAVAALDRADASLDAARLLVAANDPVRTMRRGWSYTVGPDGTVVRDPTSLQPGDHIRTRVQRGHVTSSVVGVEPDPQLSQDGDS